MLLAIDTGNTNTLFAVHDGQTWRAQWRSATDMTKTSDDYAVWLSQLMEINGLKLAEIDDCIISTVVPQSLFNQRNFARRSPEREKRTKAIEIVRIPCANGNLIKGVNRHESEALRSLTRSG